MATEPGNPQGSDTGKGREDITFLSNKKYRHYLEQSKATAVLITEADLPFCPTNALVLKDPMWALPGPTVDTTRSRPRISIRAPSSRRTQLGERVAIRANAVIESGVVLGMMCASVQAVSLARIPDWELAPGCGPTSPCITTSPWAPTVWFNPAQ